MDIKKLVEEYEAKLDASLNFYMDVEALLDILDYYIREDRTAEADLCLSIALRLFPDNEEVLLSKAYRLKDSNKWTEARRIVNSLSDQSNRDVQLFYVEELLAEAQPEKAEQLLATMLPKVMLPQDYDWYTDYAELLIDYNFYPRAISVLDRVPKEYPGMEHCLELKSEAYFMLKDFRQSADVQNQIIDLNPYNEKAWIQLAEAQFHLQQFEEAEESCNYALAIAPESVRAIRVKLYAIVAREDAERAIALAKEYLPTHPEDYYFYMKLGELCLRQEKISLALGYLQKAIKYCPLESADRLDLLRSISKCHLYSQKYDEAVEFFAANHQMSTAAYEDKLALIAGYCFAHDATENAVRYLRESVEMQQLDAEGYAFLARMLFKNGCFHPAADLWEKIFKFSDALPADVQGYIEEAKQRLEEGES